LLLRLFSSHRIYGPGKQENTVRSEDERAEAKNEPTRNGQTISDERRPERG